MNAQEFVTMIAMMRKTKDASEAIKTINLLIQQAKHVEKLNPETMGVELAQYIHLKRLTLSKVITYNSETCALFETYELTLERDFWRAKALNHPLK